MTSVLFFLKYLNIYIYIGKSIHFVNGKYTLLIENIRFITCEKEIEFYKCQDTLKNHTLLYKKKTSLPKLRKSITVKIYFNNWKTILYYKKKTLAQSKKPYHLKNLFKKLSHLINNNLQKQKKIGLMIYF